MASRTMKLRTVRMIEVDAPPTRITAPTIRSAKDAADIARAALPTDREGFLVMHLDSHMKVRSTVQAHVGSLDSTMVHPREVFKAAILANSAEIIVAHNHPSGDLTPSDADREITVRLIAAGVLLDIPVRDHVIVTARGYFSMRENDGQ